MTDTQIENSIRDNATGPKSVSGDAGSVQQHSLPDQIAADKHLQSKAIQPVKPTTMEAILNCARGLKAKNLGVGWIETTAFFARTWQGFVAFFARTCGFLTFE